MVMIMVMVNTCNSVAGVRVRVAGVRTVVEISVNNTNAGRILGCNSSDFHTVPFLIHVQTIEFQKFRSKGETYYHNHCECNYRMLGHLFLLILLHLRL